MIKAVNEKMPVKIVGYDPAQRAYLIDYAQVKQPKAIQFEIAASEDSPIVNPAFLINNWGKKDAVLELNGSVVDRGADFRFGHYGSLDVDDDQEWKEVLTMWVQVKSSKPLRIKLSPRPR